MPGGSTWGKKKKDGGLTVEFHVQTEPFVMPIMTVADDNAMLPCKVRHL
jgi:hypothetical protein